MAHSQSCVREGTLPDMHDSSDLLGVRDAAEVVNTADYSGCFIYKSPLYLNQIHKNCVRGSSIQLRVFYTLRSVCTKWKLLVWGNIPPEDRFLPQSPPISLTNDAPSGIIISETQYHSRKKRY